MRALVIVVVTPERGQLGGVAQVGDPVLAEALATQAATEARDEAILHGLYRRDLVPLDLAVFLPPKNGMRHQLGPLLADLHSGIAARSGNRIKRTGTTLAGD
ncbi:hypothetical protein GCM10011415_40090 [Salipiger pallidus]|uniref:Uncharacterized protein n=1 Tax=Salipiger pallidus TaxID=1775170 RepID=A0A8J3EIB0_9RHOB|nr:hypothetical protein GCM10011415_40090 [Salipiger pallidus]